MNHYFGFAAMVSIHCSFVIMLHNPLSCASGKEYLKGNGDQVYEKNSGN